MKRFKLCDNVSYRIIDKEAVVIRLDEGKVHCLNEVGARILDLITRNRPLGEIIALLEQEYEVAVEDARCDVFRLVEELLDAGIVEEVSGSCP